MDHVADFAAKLDLMLKAVSMSRVALAQRLGVDKSLVGRWLAGTVHPGEHNLARLSAILAESFPGFRLSDWFDSLDAIARRHGIERPSVPEDARPLLPGPLAAFLESSGPELEHRAGAYEGFWRTSRPSLLMRDHIFHDYGMIRRPADGLVEVLMKGAGLDFSGWLFPASGNIFVFLFDSTGRTPMSLVCRGVSLPKAMVLEGILLLAALDPNRTPAALPILIERVGDLSGNEAADLARYHELESSMPEPAEPFAREDVVARLYRDIGPDAATAGGDIFLTVSSAHSLSRGVTKAGLQG